MGAVCSHLLPLCSGTLGVWGLQTSIAMLNQLRTKAVQCISVLCLEHTVRLPMPSFPLK